MGLMKLRAYFRSLPGKVRKTFHRELGAPDHPTLILRCLMCDWGADYSRLWLGDGTKPGDIILGNHCPRCGSWLVEGER